MGKVKMWLVEYDDTSMSQICVIAGSIKNAIDKANENKSERKGEIITKVELIATED